MLPMVSAFAPVSVGLCLAHAFLAAFLASFLVGAYPLEPPQLQVYQPVFWCCVSLIRRLDDGVGNSAKLV